MLNKVYGPNGLIDPAAYAADRTEFLNPPPFVCRSKLVLKEAAVPSRRLVTNAVGS